MTDHPLVDTVRRFLGDPGSADFEALALEAFAFQYEHIDAYRSLCERRGIEPGSLSSWQEIPAVPSAAFRSLRLAAAEPREIFRSSGTTRTGGGEEAASRSVHHHPFPDLYREVIDASFPAFCLPHGGRPPMLSLIPPREDLPDSSLSFMVEHILERYGGAGSGHAFGARGLDFPRFRSWCSARQRSGQGGMILTTSFALAHALQRLHRTGLRFRLPAATTIFETGGFKGKAEEVEPAEHRRLLAEYLGVSPQQVVSEYGMTELTSQCYSRSLFGEDPALLHPPHWMRVRILEPLTLAEAPAGEIGLVALLDLANLGSAVHLLSEDLGAAEGKGFRLRGRAAGAELRGCSLAAEQMLR